MYEGPSVALKPQGLKGPWSRSEYSGTLPSLPPWAKEFPDAYGRDYYLFGAP